MATKGTGPKELGKDYSRSPTRREDGGGGGKLTIGMKNAFKPKSSSGSPKITKAKGAKLTPSAGGKQAAAEATARAKQAAIEAATRQQATGQAVTTTPAAAVQERTFSQRVGDFIERNFFETEVPSAEGPYAMEATGLGPAGQVVDAATVMGASEAISVVGETVLEKKMRDAAKAREGVPGYSVGYLDGDRAQSVTASPGVFGEKTVTGPSNPRQDTLGISRQLSGGDVGNVTTSLRPDREGPRQTIADILKARRERQARPEAPTPAPVAPQAPAKPQGDTFNLTTFDDLLGGGGYAGYGGTGGVTPLPSTVVNTVQPGRRRRGARALLA